MELRIFCQHGSCENMLRTEVQLGCRNEKDILDIYGWKKIDDVIVCRECLQIDRERAEIISLPQL